MKPTVKQRQGYLWLCVAMAAALWFYMFSPWTAGLTNFWVTMACAGLCLTTLALAGDGKALRHDLRGCRWAGQLLLGLAIAAALWGLFWVGDKVSAWMLPFARPQVDSIYGMKQGLPPWAIALLLLLVIGPAEEIFWRGFVQRRLAARFGTFVGLAAATAIYTLIHIWSLNFMLVMSALVCGCVWGGLYWLKPRWLPALVVSHAVWDACVFVVFPI